VIARGAPRKTGVGDTQVQVGGQVDASLFGIDLGSLVGTALDFVKKAIPGGIDDILIDKASKVFTGGDKSAAGPCGKGSVSIAGKCRGLVPLLETPVLTGPGRVEPRSPGRAATGRVVAVRSDRSPPGAWVPVMGMEDRSAIAPMSKQSERLDCPEDYVLGKDDLCYATLPNSLRKHPSSKKTNMPAKRRKRHTHSDHHKPRARSRSKVGCYKKYKGKCYSKKQVLAGLTGKANRAAARRR
jgi:hypothetical protein